MNVHAPSFALVSSWLLLNVAWTWYLFVHLLLEREKITIRSLLILTFQIAVALNLALAATRPLP